MSGASVTINSTRGMSTLVRPRFGPGMLLLHEDLEQLNVYTRELNRLVFRSLFGCGVVCGLVVSTQQKCGQGRISVGAGLALTCDGDPIYVPKDQSLAIDEKCDPNLPSELWVVLCSTVRGCAPRTSMCPSDDDETTSVCTREREGWEIRVVSEKPKCVCRCEPPVDNLEETDCMCLAPIPDCYEDHYAGRRSCECHDSNGGCCDCVLLARLERRDDTTPDWIADHRVRRFVRPVLMRDPQVWIEQERKKKEEQDAKATTPDQSTTAAATAPARGKPARSRGSAPRPP
jgi:hypothetical protein